MDNAMLLAQVIKFLLPYDVTFGTPTIIFWPTCLTKAFTFYLAALDRKITVFRCSAYHGNLLVLLPLRLFPCPSPTQICRVSSPIVVTNDLNIVRLIHLEAGYSNPLENNWMRGIQRCRGTGDPPSDTRLPGPG